jgi:pyrrolysyl-tRNA synthetase-like protein
MVENANLKREAKRYYRKKNKLFPLIEKIKLWPSRSGALHSVRSIEIQGETATITTHCGKTFTAANSRRSRAARWLRNKYFRQACPACGVPDWKLKKYGQTFFSRHQGKLLKGKDS